MSHGVKSNNLFQSCKHKILPDPSHSAFNSCDACTPTRVLAAAVFCTLKKHLFDETTPRAEVASKFCVTAAQLHKAVTGIDYKSGPHVYKKKHKVPSQAAPTSQPQKKTQVHLQKLTKRQRQKKLSRNLMIMTPIQCKTHCHQPVLIPCIIPLYNLRHISFL